LVALIDFDASSENALLHDIPHKAVPLAVA
jgi:hypothetical protein